MRDIWRDEDFSFSLDVLYGNLGISKLQFLIKDNIDFISAVIIFFLQIFGYQNLGSVLTKKCWSGSVFRSSLKPMRIRNTDIIRHIFLHEAAMGYLHSICSCFHFSPRSCRTLCFVSFFVYALLFISFVFRYCPSSRLLMTVKIN